MQYEVNSPVEYLDHLEEGWKKDRLSQIRSILINAPLGLQEDIEYKMLCYRYAGKSVFHLNAQKHYVSFYVGNLQKIPNAHSLLSSFDLGKGCIRIRKKDDFSQENMKAFIDAAIKVWQNGGETDC